MTINIMIKYLIHILLLIPLLGNCQNFNMENSFGFYIGISSSDIKSGSEIKPYMLLVLRKNFYAINFNQLEAERMVAYSDDIIGPKWDYKCSMSIFMDNSFLIKSNNFYFILQRIDSLTLKIEGTTFTQYIGDTLYRVSSTRYNGDFLDNGWAYLPYSCSSMGEEIYILNYYLSFPQMPVWYYWNIETNSHIYRSDSLHIHPLIKKIKKKLEK